MTAALKQAYTGVVGTGVCADQNGRQSIPVIDAMRSFAFEVAIPSGTITSWSLNLEGSLDGVNWTVLATHSTTIGSTIFAVDKPVTFLRVNVTALSLNTAPSISCYVLGVA